jgi:uncharacterized membrane protein YwzB
MDSNEVILHSVVRDKFRFIIVHICCLLETDWSLQLVKCIVDHAIFGAVATV